MSRFSTNKNVVVEDGAVSVISNDWFTPPDEMQIITAMQAKGGAGKTITLMSIACCFADAGAKVLLIDADQNTPMTIWRDDARTTGMWDERLFVEAIHDSDALADRLEAADAKSEFDIVLIDTRGGTSAFNAYVAQISNLILIPARPNKLDSDNAIKTIRVILEIEKAQGTQIEKRIVFARMPAKTALRAAQKEFVKLLEQLPHTKTHLRERDAFEALPSRGPIHTLLAHYADAGSAGKLQHNTYAAAMVEAQGLAQECWALCGGLVK